MAVFLTSRMMMVSYQKINPTSLTSYLWAVMPLNFNELLQKNKDIVCLFQILLLNLSILWANPLFLEHFWRFWQKINPISAPENGLFCQENPFSSQENPFFSQENGLFS